MRAFLFRIILYCSREFFKRYFLQRNYFRSKIGEKIFGMCLSTLFYLIFWNFLKSHNHFFLKVALSLSGFTKWEFTRSLTLKNIVLKYLIFNTTKILPCSEHLSPYKTITGLYVINYWSWKVWLRLIWNIILSSNNHLVYIFTLPVIENEESTWTCEKMCVIFNHLLIKSVAVL